MKKITYFIVLSFVFLFLGIGCFFSPIKPVFAEGENDIEVSNIFAYAENFQGRSFSSSYLIGEGEYVSKTVTLLKEDGSGFGYEPDDANGIRVVDPTTLPNGIIALTYNEDQFTVEVQTQTEIWFSLRYKVVFLFEDSSTLEKTATIDIVFHTVHIELTQTELNCDLNTPLSADSFKQYIDTEKTTVPVEDITAKLSGVDFYQIASGAVKFTYEKQNYEISGKTTTLKIDKWLPINVVYPEDWQGLSLEIGDGETYSTSMNLGEVEYEKNWQYSGKLKLNVKNANFTKTNTQKFLVDFEETEVFGIYDFTVYSLEIAEGTQTIDITALFDGAESNVVTLEFSFKISAEPQINLKEKTLTLDKSITFGEIKTKAQENLVSVVDVLGEARETSSVEIDYGTLQTTYEDLDVVACGSYTITYTYTSETITHRVCKKTEQVSLLVVNTTPTINKGEVIVKVDEETISNNSRVYINKDIVVEMSATDINGDAIIFVIELSNDTVVVSNNAQTSVVKNTNKKYTISSNMVDNTSLVKFTINAPEDYFGDFGFDISVYDSGHETPGDTYDFNVTYYETGIPVIVLLTNTMIWDADEEIYILAIDQESTPRNLLTKYVVRVEDEFDKNVSTSSLQIEVTKNGVKQQMVGTTFTFSNIGVYYVTYSVTDVSGNNTTARFKVIVSEIPNDTPTVSPYILDLNQVKNKDFSYKDIISINIEECFTIDDDDAKCKQCGEMVLTGGTTCPHCNQNDAVKDILSYYNEIGAFSAADTTSTKILCTNYDSFSWDPAGKVLTFKQDPNHYYIGTLYIAFYVDDNTGLQTGISDTAFIKITYVDNIPPTVTQTQAQTTFVIGRDDHSTFDRTAYFIATNDYDKTTIPPVVNILDANGNQVLDIDFTVPSNYTLNYYFRYEQGGVEHTITKSVVIKVTTGGKPTIVLTQENLQITVGGTFDISTIISQIEDAEDGNANYETLKDKITIEGLPENYNTPGEYKIKIRYADADNNQTEKVFTLKIVEQSKVWIYIVIGIASAVFVAGIVVLIVFLVKRRYTRI